MTFNDLQRAVLQAAPDHIAYREMFAWPLELDLEMGPMPSGEEGAEDWIVSGSLNGEVQVDLENKRIILGGYYG